MVGLASSHESGRLMEQFKKSLKIAITEKLEGLRFQADHPPTLLTGSSEKKLESLPPYAASDLVSLIKSLMPHIESVERTQPVQGELAILNFGELKLIGQLEPEPRLFGFVPPQGNQLFRQIWNQLTEDLQQAPSPIEPADYQVDGIDPSETLIDGQDSSPFSLAAVGNQQDGAPHNEAKEAGQLEDFMDNALPPPPADGEFVENGDLSGGFQMTNNQPAIHDQQYHEMNLPGQKIGDSSYVPTLSSLPSIEEEQDEQGHFQNSLENDISNNLQDYAPSYQESDSFEDGELQNDQSSYKEWPQSNTIPNFEEPIADNRKTVYSSPAMIHFGPHIPGESLERNGKFPIDSILKVMLESGASDMHLTLGKSVCLRIDGEIQRMEGEVVDEDQMRSLLSPIMPVKNQEEFAEHHDTDFGYEVEGLARFRVNIFRDINGVGAVIRQIPSKIPSADDLGLPTPLRKLCSLSKGLILVTGPTGSGKSTTLAAMIDLINQSRNDHILTIEDPIEFVHEQKRCLVNQREVHRHTRSFSKALRAALREDPDIILIGEMRDLETIAIAIETAETGHLVFGTLHTNTAISTIDRLIDQFPADQQAQIRIMLAESLKGVVCQTLVKKKGGGRVAAHEILIVDRAVSSLIRESNTHMIQNHMQTQKLKGNQQLNDALFDLVAKGIVHPNDAYHRAVDKDSFLKLLQQKGLAGDLSQVS